MMGANELNYPQQQYHDNNIIINDAFHHSLSKVSSHFAPCSASKVFFSTDYQTMCDIGRVWLRALKVCVLLFGLSKSHSHILFLTTGM